MKKSVLLLLLLGTVLAVPAASYAWVDFGAYGGYAFPGRIEETGVTSRPSGGEAGAFGHFSGSVVPAILDLGIGAIYQRSFQNYSISNIRFNFNRDIIALSGYAELTLIPVIHPFVRGSVNMWDNVSGSDYTDSSSYFKTYSVGGGAFFTIFPMLSVFGEYLYTFGEQGGSSIRGSAVHGGVRVKI